MVAASSILYHIQIYYTNICLKLYSSSNRILNTRQSNCITLSLRDPSTITPSDSGQGYKQVKAKIGRSKVRPWQLEPFKNPSRSDDLVLRHWRRKADEGKVYPFSKFNKVNIFARCI